MVERRFRPSVRARAAGLNPPQKASEKAGQTTSQKFKEMDSKPPPDSPFAAYNRKWQAMLDSTTPFPLPRWALTATLFGLYILRIYVAGGWYIVSYALGIYVLSLVLQFLSPKIDPALEMDEDGPSLPTNMEDEFKPFIRRLPEFKFWYSATRAVSVALFCAMFRIFDVCLFWTAFPLTTCHVHVSTVEARETNKRAGASLLANSAHLLHRFALHYHETSNQAHDQVQVSAI